MTLSLTEITLGCMLWYLDFRFEDIEWREDYSKLAAWYEVFKQRPSVLATEIINYEE
jgi:glutathione S-transferase